MKFTLHYPVESFGFAETEIEGSYADAYFAYKLLSEAFRPSAGLPRVEWNKIVDKLLLGDSMEAEQFERFDDYQKKCYHEIEKSMARLQAKEGVEGKHFD